MAPMDFSWLKGPSEPSLASLVARKQYGRAIKVLREQLEKDPGNPVTRQNLADVLVLDGRAAEAVGLLDTLADEQARAGQAHKAIALLKKVQRLDPSRAGVEERLASLLRARGPEALEQEGERAPEAPAVDPDPAEGPPVPTPADAAAASPLFGDFTAEELVAVIRGLKLHAYEPGDVVVTEGEQSDSLFIIATGVVKAFVKDPAGRSRRVRAMADGAFFGEVSLLTGKPRTATVTAATHCELLELDKERLSAIAATHPRVRSVLESFARLRVQSEAERAIRRGPGPA